MEAIFKKKKNKTLSNRERGVNALLIITEMQLAAAEQVL